MNEQQKKNTIWNIIGATLSAFNSLFFTIIVTRLNGIDAAGIFTYSFATACLLYIVASYLGRTYQVTDISNKYSDTDYIFNRIGTCIFMIILAIGFCIIKQYDIYKTLVFVSLCGFKAIEAFSECIYAIIQRNERLDQVGKSLAVKAILGLVVFYIIDIITHNLILACVSIILMNIIVLCIYDIKNAIKLGIAKTKYINEKNFTLLKLGFFTFILTFLAQYVINSSRYAIDDLLENNFQTIFGIIIMPATFMGLLGQFIVQPILTRIANCLKVEDYSNLKKIISKMLIIVISFGLIVILGVYLIGIPVLELIYGIELKTYKNELMIIIIGSILYCIEILLSTILISMRKTLGQAIIFLIVSVISTISAYKLVDSYSIMGASVSYLVTMILISIILFVYMYMNINKLEHEKI